MKNLAISLMRLGDLLMMEPLLRELKRQSDNDLELLVYKEFSYAKDLFPYVDKWHFIDRIEMQETGRSADLSIFDNYSQLKSLINTLQKENYSGIMSLTNNKLSYSICSLLANGENNVVGAHEINGAIEYGSPWIKYLNDIASVEGVSVYHLLDIYRNSLAIELIPDIHPNPNLFYGNEISIPGEEYICIQMGSNEDKKTFDSQKWNEVILHYRLLAPSKKILLLGAPNEKESIEEFIKQSGDSNIEAAICSLKNAKALIYRSKLLVTPDTSIKYLAVGSKVPVIEVSVGSSQYNQTGTYSDHGLIVQSKQSCAPCSHTLDCPYSSFKCHDDIPSDMLGFLMMHHEERNWTAIETIAREYNDTVGLIRASISEAGLWTPIQLGEEAAEENLKNLLHQSAWKIILGGTDNEDWKRFESEAQSICQFFKMNSQYSQKDIRKALEKCEALLLGYELETQELIRALSKQNFQLEDNIFSEVSNWFDRSTKLNGKIGAFAQMYKDSMSSGAEASFKASGTQNILDNLNHMFKIERKLSEIIRVDFMEVQ